MICFDFSWFFKPKPLISCQNLFWIADMLTASSRSRWTRRPHSTPYLARAAIEVHARELQSGNVFRRRFLECARIWDFQGLIQIGCFLCEKMRILREQSFGWASNWESQTLGPNMQHALLVAREDLKVRAHTAARTRVGARSGGGRDLWKLYPKNAKYP